jgi:hypothetical protein
MGKRKKIMKLAKLYMLNETYNAVEKRTGKKMRLLDEEEAVEVPKRREWSKEWLLKRDQPDG